MKTSNFTPKLSTNEPKFVVMFCISTKNLNLRSVTKVFINFRLYCHVMDSLLGYPQSHIKALYLSSRGGLEVERLLHNLHDSTLVDSNPALGQKDFCSNSKTMGGALINNVQK